MNLYLRNTLARILLAAYVLAGVLLEVGHRDVHNIVLDATPVLSSHGCGATEIHVPLDKRHDCLACTQSMQRVATAGTYVPSNSIHFASLARSQDQAANPPLIDVVHSGKRGPPSLFE
jgi:hypothetical protein